ncbi:MAG: hypothetical protein A2283_05450 [Lentisphaerae bacterium RIFOXYA12_FULL_48_11]|nr:MAG: hypothetical protein A2283_05450 [Lentisphaerae bacterium RIFOXYA12_FULL_48_11]
MKIKSYKGSSLEGIYEAIHKELGPEAVVLKPQKIRSLGGLLGHTQYEVVAVAEDAEADTHLLSASKMAALAQFEKISVQNKEKLEEMQKLFSEIKQDLRGVSGNTTAASFLDNVIPDFAEDWDPRFVRKVREKTGGIFDGDQKNMMAIKEGVADLLRVQGKLSISRSKNRPHVVVLVGPTGSGKTTTLAKLAARWSLEGGLKVGVITTDTYRVAAIDQIKEYALLLGLELKVAFSASEAARALEYFKDKDVVLVDTPGRSFYDQMGMMAMKGIIQAMGRTTMFLLVPASLDRGNVSDLVKNYQVLKPDYLVVTKTDETRRFGVFTTLMCETQCPVAFLTNGQRVPQDIASAKLEDIVKMVTGEVKDINTKNHIAVKIEEEHIPPFQMPPHYDVFREPGEETGMDNQKGDTNLFPLESEAYSASDFIQKQCA